MAKDCGTCPFVQWKQCAITRNEAKLEEAETMAGGFAAFMAMSPENMLIAVLKDTLDQTMKDGAEAGKPLIPETLIKHPSYGASYLRYVDLLSGHISKDGRAVERAQGTCKGPERKFNLWIGRKALVCTGKGTMFWQPVYLKPENRYDKP